MFFPCPFINRPHGYLQKNLYSESSLKTIALDCFLLIDKDLAAKIIILLQSPNIVKLRVTQGRTCSLFKMGSQDMGRTQEMVNRGNNNNFLNNE